MAELKRKEDQLTTADLAGRADQGDIRDVEQPNRPHLVRHEGSGLNSQDDDVAFGGPRPDMQPQTELRTDADNAALRPHDINRGTPGANDPNNAAPLFSQTQIGDLRGRWSNVQASFVDEPRRCVEEADKLVATVMQQLAEGFANERSTLEKQWDRGDSVSTEDLRIALQRYRSFFDRLLNA